MSKQKLGFTLANFKQKAKAFTLAEVLITLAIIGIVAALTIPNLVKNYQQHQYIVQLKKVQNTLNKAAYMYIAQGGKINCNVNGDSGFDAQDAGEIMSCIAGISGVNCSGINDVIDGIKGNLSIVNPDEDTIDSLYDISIYDFNNEEKDTYDDSYIFLKDGSAIKFSTTLGGFARTLPKDYCWGFVTDVNGPFKKPNKIGYDVFGFYLSEKGQVMPVGSKIGDYDGGVQERVRKGTIIKSCNATLSELGDGLCATTYALKGKNPDGTEYWKGIKYWNDI